MAKNRFDNLSTEDLLKREAEARAEAKQLAEALKARLLAECPLRIGHVYAFGPETLRPGLEFLVCGLVPDNFSPFGDHPRYAVGVHGYRANAKSTAGDGFGIKASVVQDWRVFDLSTERPGPRPSLLEYGERFDPRRAREETE